LWHDWVAVVSAPMARNMRRNVAPLKRTGKR
jgi:hypothetical protein